MKIGFVGSGNMASAIARGLGEPALFADSGSGRAQELASVVGGEATGAPEVFESSDVVFLCHKPAQLAEVAAIAGEFDGVIVSVLAVTTLDDLRTAYPHARIVRTMPNIPVASGNGVVAIAGGSSVSDELAALFDRLGLVVEVEESQFDLVTAIGGCAPAFFAMFARDLIESATGRGMDAELAASVVNQTLAGTAAALADNGVDTAQLMRAVASPGGLTERALASFEEFGLADGVDGAVATVLGE